MKAQPQWGRGTEVRPQGGNLCWGVGVPRKASPGVLAGGGRVTLRARPSGAQHRPGNLCSVLRSRCSFSSLEPISGFAQSRLTDEPGESETQVRGEGGTLLAQ